MINAGDNIVDLWDAMLLRDKGRLRKGSPQNAYIYLKYHPDCARKIRFNDLTQEINVIEKMPWIDKGPFPRALHDRDAHNFIRWLDDQGQTGISKSTGLSTIKSISYENSFNPLREYLWNLKWDGQPRINNWLTYYLGLEDQAYGKIVGPKFLIGAAARALNPGCKMDTMLVLEGPQGLLKSTSVRVLFGPQYFTDELSVYGSKDASMQLQGMWGVEVAELAQFGKTEVEKIKEFISRTNDRFRPPYEATLVNLPRSCVFVGTTNATEYLRDATGARRFWPVKCQAIDIDALQSDREQLWSEAIIRMREGEKHWIEASDFETVEQEQQQRYDQDPWTERILTYINNVQMTTVNLILSDCINIEMSIVNQGHKNRVSNILRMAGWEVTVSKTNDRTSFRQYRRTSTVSTLFDF